MKKKIDVTVGYKIVEDGKPTRYFAGDTGEGMCYKDIDAYKNDNDICYIPECEFDGEGWSVEYRDGLGYAREDILNCILDELRWNYEGIPVCDEFCAYEAECIIEEAEWESVGVILDRIDLDEDWEMFNNK